MKHKTNKIRKGEMIIGTLEQIKSYLINNLEILDGDSKLVQTAFKTKQTVNTTLFFSSIEDQLNVIDKIPARFGMVVYLKGKNKSDFNTPEITFTRQNIWILIESGKIEPSLQPQTEVKP